MLIVEVRVAATKLPPIPGVPLDFEEWQIFNASLLEAAHTSQRSALSMLTTLVLGGSGAGAPRRRFSQRAMHFTATLASWRSPSRSASSPSGMFG